MAATQFSVLLNVHIMVVIIEKGMWHFWGAVVATVINVLKRWWGGLDLWMHAL